MLFLDEILPNLLANLSFSDKPVIKNLPPSTLLMNQSILGISYIWRLSHSLLKLYVLVAHFHRHFVASSVLFRNLKLAK